MVDITIANGDYFMVYKPTNITWGTHPVVSIDITIATLGMFITVM